MKTTNCFENEGVSTPRQFRRVVALWEGLSGAPAGGKGMPPFCILLPQNLAMESRPRPGPDDTRCTGEERLPAIQTLGRVMPPSSHARQLSQVCQCSLSPSWPGCSRCWEMPMPARLRSLQKLWRTSGDLKDLVKLGIDLETSLAILALASPPVDSVVTIIRAPIEALDHLDVVMNIIWDVTLVAGSEFDILLR